MTKSRITALAGWAGGKRTNAAKINAELGNPTRLFVPFAGGFPTLMTCPTEFYNDANWKPIAVLRALQEDAVRVGFLLAGREFLKQEFEAARDSLSLIDTHPYVSQALLAADLLTVWWMGPGGIVGTTTKPWFAQRHTNTGGCPRKRWESFRASLPAIAERYEGVGLDCLDFRKFLGRIGDREGDAVYSDSPYFRKKFKYEVDFEPQDHIDLAAILNGFKKARVVVSYDDAPELVDLYPESKWRRVRIEMAKAMSHASGKSKRNTEILLVNDAGWEPTP